MANPTALLLSAAKMLEHVGLPKYGQQVKLGVEKTLRAGKVKTRDLGGFATTQQFTEAVVNNIK